ncbi:MAG: phosphatidylglycerophosphatase A [Bdellovibrionaceae bacterium]|nr:phosphatidylglycerophosphatase A [Pseudobdellovibrionaceae bacterium]MBX3032757.1 phosphatidylglycerophosphatase A [Pseudobdellovibrionaceae bacterium]
MRKLLLLIATFFGVGRLPRSPGTWGTLATIPLALLLMWLGPLWHMAVIVVLLPLGIWAADAFDRSETRHDCQEIVIDEVLGFLITMLWMPLTWQAVVIGFVLFRTLDILKPFPISVLDQRVKGGFGVMVDDVAAGLIANLVMQVILSQTAWLGVQSLVISSRGGG